MSNHDYPSVILRYCMQLSDSLNKRNIKDRRGLVTHMSNDYEFCAFITSYLQHIGEYSKKLPADFKNSNSTINWNRLYRTRNIVAHDYETVRYEQVAAMIFTQVQPLLLLLQAYIQQRR